MVCPELFLSGYNVGDEVRQLAEPQGGAFAQAAAALAREARRTALVYGYPEQADDVVYNAAICIDAEGSDNRASQQAAAPERISSERTSRPAMPTRRSS